MKVSINTYQYRKRGGVNVDIEAEVGNLEELETLADGLAGELMDRPEAAAEAMAAPMQQSARKPYMHVGSVEGKAGAIVEVPVYGGSAGKQIDGFHIAVGSGHILNPEGYVLGKFFREYLGDRSWANYSAIPNGKPEPFINFSLGFFKIGHTTVEDVAPAVVVPWNTELVRLRFKIPEGVKPQERILYIQDNWFRKGDGTGRAQVMFTKGSGPADEIVVGGIDVELEPKAGKVTVIP